MGHQDTNKDTDTEPEEKWYNWRPPVSTRHYVEIAVLVGYIIFDGYGVFPTHHFVGILSIVLLVWILLFPEMVVWRWLTFVAVSAALSIFLYAYVGPTLPEETETHGWLFPSNKPEVHTGCSSAEQGIEFFIGGNVTKIIGSADSFPLINIDNTPIISFVRDGHALSFDALLYNESGHIVASVDKGEFHLREGSYFYHNERENDRSILTIVDDKNRVILNIYYMNYVNVSITGIFYSKSGTKVAITDNNILVGAHNTFSRNCLYNAGLDIGPAGVRILAAPPRPTSLDARKTPSIFAQALDRITGWFK
jgi:energy-coupling factor transporter transmembrane protein EcfT